MRFQELMIYIVGTDQLYTTSAGMHQGNVRDLPDDMRCGYEIFKVE